MKVFNVTSQNINNGQELADWIYNKIKAIDYKSQEDLNEGELITEACQSLGWQSVPQTGGIIIEWDEQ